MVRVGRALLLGNLARNQRSAGVQFAVPTRQKLTVGQILQYRIANFWGNAGGDPLPALTETGFIATGMACMLKNIDAIRLRRFSQHLKCHIDRRIIIGHGHQCLGRDRDASE